MYRKATLRRLPPTTRRYARTINDLQGIVKRLQNLAEDIARLEVDSLALHNRQKYEEARRQSDEAELTRRIDAAELFNEDGVRWQKAGELHAIHNPIDKTTEIQHGSALASQRRTTTNYQQALDYLQEIDPIITGDPLYVEAMNKAKDALTDCLELGLTGEDE